MGTAPLRPAKIPPSLHQWIVRKRMARAAALLAQGMDPKGVSWALGYKQHSHFWREFKRFHGVTPGNFANTDPAP